MTRPFLESDVLRGFQWLDHQPYYTELAALHPDYRPGREHAEWNHEREAYTRIAYIDRGPQLLSFVRRYHPTRMVCCSFNLRTQPRIGPHGFPVATRENEIEVSRNLLLDFDLIGQSLPSRHDALQRFLREDVGSYFQDLGFVAPTLAFTGASYHVLAAYGPIHTGQYRDLRERLRAFRDEIARAFRQELSRLEVELDRTQDLRRMVKMYGTAKPGGELSRFYGRERQPDHRLREHVVSLDIPQRRSGPVALEASEDLPERFERLLATDAKLAGLWQGNDKPADTDTTRSGYEHAEPSSSA